MKKNVFFLLIAFSLSLAFLSCSSSDDDDGNDSGVVGKWLLMDFSSEPINKPTQEVDWGEFMQFNSNGTMYWNNRMCGNTSFNYTMSGNNIVCTCTTDTEKNTVMTIVSESGGVLCLYDNVEGFYRYLKLM